MTTKTIRAPGGAARWTGVSFLTILLCTALFAFPTTAGATAGVVNKHEWCILGFVSPQVQYGRAWVIAQTNGFCDWGDLSSVTDPSQLGPNNTPVVSRQVSVRGIAWYVDGYGNWQQCPNGYGQETKASNVNQVSGFVDITSCPHGTILSVWAHVAAQEFSGSSWQGGDVYGAAFYYP